MKYYSTMKNIKIFLLITVGSVLETIGIYFFKFPNHFSTGGISGLAIVCSHFFKSVTPGTFILITNILLLIIGSIFVSGKFGIKTVYCSILMSVFTRLLEIICPISAPITSMPLLEMIFAVFLAGFGAAILFNYGASTGGTEIIAMLLKRVFETNVSKVLFVVDFVIVMLTYFAFGIETWLLCVFGLAMKILVLNNILESFNSSKYCTIITTHAAEVSEYITKNLKKSATVSNAFYGGFTNDERSVLLTVVRRGHVIMLKKYIKALDPNAFIIVSTTSEITGKGFRECI